MAGTFKRVEIKYLMNEQQRTRLLEALGARATNDEYGLHTICNIYYDTGRNDLIRRSIDKPVYKEKFRVRSYGVPGEQSPVFLEIKKKYKGTVYKRRASMKLCDARRYLETGEYPKAYDSQILREIDYMLKYYDLKPSLYLAYDRRAYYLTDMPEVRFTIDKNIRSREDVLLLEKGDRGDKLFETDLSLMEIKAPGAIPIWFADILAENGIYKKSFSKYGKIYESLHKIKDIDQVLNLDMEGERE